MFILSMPTLYIFEMFYLYHNVDPLSEIGYCIVYLVYTLPVLFFSIGYMYVAPLKTLVLIKSTTASTTKPALVFLFFAVFLYLPVMKEFAGDLLSPRAIYTATRSGFGLSYYGSAVACYIFLILALFNSSWGTPLKTIAVLFSSFFAFIHGSKGQVMTILFVVLVYFICTSTRKLKFWVASVIVVIFGVVGATAFYSSVKGVEIEDLILVMAGYSDYTRNAVMLIDSSRGFEFGKIFFEDNFFSRIPRAFYPDKPKDFGSFALALQYFPDSFYRDAGVPSFGVGAFYADVGLLVIPLSTIAGFIGGMSSRTLIARLRMYGNPGDFILLCYLIGIVLIPIGVGNLLPEHIVLAFFVYIISRKKFTDLKMKNDGCSPINSMKV